MRKKERKKLEIIEGTVIPFDPTPHQIKLSTIADCRREMARVYRDARTAKIDTSEASRLVYMLSQIGKLIETGQLEQRLIELENRLLR
jgi:hypothetical protein